MIVLDGIIFDGLEMPETINMGGKQTLAVHEIIGGLRVVDAMGPDDEVIDWKGYLIGESAQLRALQLDLLRRSGRQVELEFGLRIYRVVVNAFRSELTQPTLLTYNISCTVVEDLIAGDGGQQSEEIEAMVAADIALVESVAATKFAIMATAAFVRNTISNPRGGLTLLRNVGFEALGAARDALATGIIGVAAEAATTNGLIAAVGGLGGVEAGGDPEDMAAALATTQTAADDAYSLQIAEAAMTRTRLNLEQAPS